jgi:SagB-type dehydrogenase family enzyme
MACYGIVASDRPNSALNYHEATKHSELSVRTSARYLDWQNKPSPYKVYIGLPSIALPRDFPRPREASLRAISGVPHDTITKSVDLGIIAEILFFSAGLTRKIKTGERFYYMRAAAATGALYPIETYVICGEIAGLRAGVYHFNPLDFALVRLRDGDYRAEVAAAIAEDTLGAPATIAFTSLAWRNAWKYEARSYRHWFWDSGVIAANLLATSSSRGLVTQLFMGFIDSRVDRLLGLTANREATVALAQVGVGLDNRVEETVKDVLPLNLDVEPLSREEVAYPIVWATNEASEFRTAAEVMSWRQGLKPRGSAIRHTSSDFPLRTAKQDPILSLEEVILRRGSTRRFARQSIPFDLLSEIIAASASDIPLDFLPRKETLIDFYFIANQVEGLPPGSYFFDRKTDVLKQLKAGSFWNMSGYLCLEQPLFSDASVVFYLMADLRQVIGSLGDRGYRAAQFEAGIRAGKIYLSSYSLMIGATGSTFYDDAVTEFFSPHAKDKSAMIAVGIGMPAYTARSGSILPQLIAKP